MSSRTSSGLLNPKRASGDSSSSSTSTSGSSSLNPKRASGTGVLKPTASSSAATAGASILRKKSPNNSLDTAAKGVAGLKVGDSPPGGSRRLPVASTRRRGDDDTPSAAPASSSSSSSSSASSSLSAAKANQARRRLSITAGKDDASKLDGHSTDDSVKDPLTKVLKSMSAASAQPAAAAAASSVGSSAPTKPKCRPFNHYSSLSKCGFVPFNANKVNQDRSVEIAKFGNNEEKAFFGVFDGHGSLGHEVSSFLISELPKFFLRQANLDSNPHEAISKAFVDCNVKLASSAIDCTFSGSTAIVVYISNGKIYSCNAGDSRAVLARTSPNDSKSTAIALSSDQKPEREDEKKRILECKGRVEACKGMRGEDIGPPRVWLSHQDVPGLAMTRSFGDLIAASVGVIPKPEIWERDATDTDKFMVLASDGVWEFISNQEAVDIVDRHWPNTEKGAAALVEEATRRWHAEEEVVDDITCIVVAFQPA